MGNDPVPGAAQRLLQQTAQLNRKHAATAREERRAFNIFSMLRAEDDEVNLHSRFLFEVLNPQGTHGMGTAFLERFLAQAGLETFDVTTATVQREVQNMDIFIANAARQAVILENKIFAPDQPKQLMRYYKAVRKAGYRDVSVLYLTLYGDAPGAESAGNLDEEILTLIWPSSTRPNATPTSTNWWKKSPPPLSSSTRRVSAIPGLRNKQTGENDADTARTYRTRRPPPTLPVSGTPPLPS